MNESLLFSIVWTILMSALFITTYIRHSNLWSEYNDIVRDRELYMSRHIAELNRNKILSNENLELRRELAKQALHIQRIAATAAQQMEFMAKLKIQNNPPPSPFPPRYIKPDMLIPKGEDNK